MTIRRLPSIILLGLVSALLTSTGRSQVPCPDQLATITTGGTATVGSSATWPGIFFDISVTNPAGISICGMSLPVRGGTLDFDFDVTPDSYVGKDTDWTQWHRAGWATGSTVPTTTTAVTLSPITFAEPIYLPSGNYGISIWCNNFLGPCTLISSNGPPGVFANADLAFLPTPGLVRTDMFAGTAIPNENWNGILHYSNVGSTGEAGLGFFGSGCPGSWGISDVYPAGLPRLGQALGVDIYNMAYDVAVMAIGLSRTTSTFGPLPFDMTVLGAPGCFGRVSLDATSLVVGTFGAAHWSMQVPSAPSVVGLQFYLQGYPLDAPANAFGIIASEALAGIVGN